MTLREAAELAGVTPATLRQAVHRGTLRAHKRGRDWAVTPRELARYQAGGRDMTKRTQRDVVLAYMRDAGERGITQLQCTAIGGGTRLAAIIRELRLDGYNITTRTLTVENVLGGTSHPGVYVLGAPERIAPKPKPMLQLRIDGGEEAVEEATA